MAFNIENGAIFISDSHANTNKQEFTKWLEFVSKNHPNFSQIFFMGDMFDFLANTTYSQIFYTQEINLINKLSQIYEIYYFEGNHDFNLNQIFPNVKVFDLQDQPVRFNSKAGEVLLCHGDKFVPFISKIFMKSLRNKKFLKFMDFIDKNTNFKISKAILKSQENKKLYKKHSNFKALISKKIESYSAKWIIEGHYHQDEILEFKDKKYINLNSFAVKSKIYQVNFGKNILILKPFEYNF